MNNQQRPPHHSFWENLRILVQGAHAQHRFSHIVQVLGAAGVFLLSYRYLLPKCLPAAAFPTFTSEKNLHDFYDKLVSTFHAIVCVAMATLYLTRSIEKKWIKRGFRFSMGYLLSGIIIRYDIVRTVKDVFILHHVILFLILAIADDRYTYLIARGVIGEIVMLPINYGWYIIHAKESRTVLLVCCVLGIVLYYMTRVYNFSVILYTLYQNNDRLGTTIFAPLVVMTYCWYGVIWYKSIEQYLIYHFAP